MRSLEGYSESILSPYIKQKLESTTISIGSLDSIPAIDMVEKGRLEGWCWQSAIFLSVFFGDESTVLRGNLAKLNYNPDYLHSWIEFQQNDTEIVFDPALNYLCRKNIYYEEFDINVIQQISTKEIRTSLIESIIENPTEIIYIPGTDNIKDPFFRTNSSFSGKIGNDGSITELHTRFYSIG